MRSCPMGRNRTVVTMVKMVAVVAAALASSSFAIAENASSSFSEHEGGEASSSFSEHEGEEAAGGHDEHEHSDFGIGALVLAMALGTACRMYITHMTGLPYTVILLVLGLAFGVMLHEKVLDNLAGFWESLEKWAAVSPDVILFVFLPVLIFESAFNTDVHIFQREFWQVLTLAVPGVVLATILTASVVKYAFPYDWGWDACLMVGGMLSATDPVAVVALLKELGVSERLAVLIEGESLLNDATAIVVFIVFRDAVVGFKDSSPVSVLETAARMSLGGPVVGVVLGMLGSFSLGYIIDDGLTEITLTVIVCFSAFMISEATKLEVSGVLAVVTTGLVMSFYARGRISPGVEETMHTFWSMATYVANTVIFFISGLIIGDRALFDDHIEAREWGLLGLLYVALQLIRFLVVLILLPVLTRGGYGMSHKQLAVLAFAGLRGAVVLTLGLIVVEDERIDEYMRGQVLFYVAGIAAMTLVINGTLTGTLVHYLGLDRSTTAETEIFVRACSAIEARLEHKLDLLKGDRFLGDADWELVWRYIPISTAKSYWHRIRHGNINLCEAEEEEIHVHAESHGLREGGGLKEHVRFRCRQVRKWFTRRVLRLHGGANYEDIPFRLRQTWYTYHKNFHMRNEMTSSHLNFDRHRRDMELHRLNAEPRMVLEAEAWSNLNAGGADLIADSQTPASSTLRKHLDNVGINGLADAAGMMSDLGQAEMAQQATGAARRNMVGRGNRALSSSQEIVMPAGMTSISIPGVDLGGGGGVGGVFGGVVGTTAASGFAADVVGVGGASGVAGGVWGWGGAGGSSVEETLKAVEGIKKLKEDRRRAAQAVAKAEARLTRLQKDLGWRKHKGEEEEMAESILQAKGKPGDAAMMLMPRSDRDDSDGALRHHTNPYFAPTPTTTKSNNKNNNNKDDNLSLGSDGGYSFAYLDAAAAAADSTHEEKQKEMDNNSNSTAGGAAVRVAPYFRRRTLDGQTTVTLPSSAEKAAARNNHFFGALGHASAPVGGDNSGEVTSDRIADLKGGHRHGRSGVGGSGSGSGSGWGFGLGLGLEDGSGDDRGGSREVGADGWIERSASWAANMAGGAFTAALAAAGSVKHEVPPSNLEGVAPEWDPYDKNDGDNADSDGSGLERSGRGTAMGGVGRRRRGVAAGEGRRRGSSGSSRGGDVDVGSGVMGPGAVTLDSMSEARVRFLTAVKAHCTERYRQGWLSSTGLRVLKENMDAQLDHEEHELDQWSHLKEAFTLPALSLASIRKIPVLGSILEPYVYRRLTFIFELASNFISAHEDVDILELLNEGPVAYQLALEKNLQLKEARETLSKQLPVFPELARSLKTQVAARYMLVQHREVVHELFHHGHINEREFEGLIGQNNTARVRLDYHPHADQIPDRVTLLKNVPFLRFLTDEEKEAIINDEKACKEEFYGSNVVLMKEKTSSAKGHKRAGWFNVVRGAVRQTTEGLLDHTSLGGTVRKRRLAKERLVNAGTVIGLDEQLLQAPFQCTYVTASFVHVFFFDKTQLLALAEQYPGLKRGLWWLLAVSVVRHHRGFRRMNLMGVYQLMRTAEFRELRQGPATLTQSTHARGRGGQPKIAPSSPPLAATFSSSRHKNRASPRTPASNRKTAEDSDIRNAPAFIRAAASAAASTITGSRHKISMGLRRTVSRGSLAEPGARVDNPGDQNIPNVVKHRVVLEAGAQVLLLRGTVFPREMSHPLGGVASRTAVTIIRDVVGPVDFSDGAVVFIMPAVLMQRSTSNHQLLMGEIQARHMAMEAAALEEATAAAVAASVAIGEVPLTTPALSKGKSNTLSASGGFLAQPAPVSPSRINLGPPAGALITMRDTGELQHAGELSLRNAMATDAGTIAALDEANPKAHPDTLRRKRTLRDAGLAAKADPAAWALSAEGMGVSDGKSGGRSRQNSAASAVGGGQTTVSTRLALHSSSNRHGDMFVEMMEMPVAHMDEDSPRSSRAPSALLYPDSYVIDPAVHAEQVARRLEEDRLQREGRVENEGIMQPAWGAGGTAEARVAAPGAPTEGVASGDLADTEGRNDEPEDFWHPVDGDDPGD